MVKRATLLLAVEQPVSNSEQLKLCIRSPLTGERKACRNMVGAEDKMEADSEVENVKLQLFDSFTKHSRRLA